MSFLRMKKHAAKKSPATYEVHEVPKPELLEAEPVSLDRRPLEKEEIGQRKQRKFSP